MVLKVKAKRQRDLVGVVGLLPFVSPGVSTNQPLKCPTAKQPPKEATAGRANRRARIFAVRIAFPVAGGLTAILSEPNATMVGD